MDPQLNLLDTPPVVKLTDRQRAILLQLRQAGQLDAGQAGATAHALKTGRWAHPADQQCDFCDRDGRAILDALVTKGLARRRRPGNGRTVYQPTHPQPDPLANDPELAAAYDAPVAQGGHGQLPEGF